MNPVIPKGRNMLKSMKSTAYIIPTTLIFALEIINIKCSYIEI